MDGVDTNLVRRSGRIFTKVEYSDTLLLAISRKRWPKEWREKSEIDVTSNGQHVDMTRAERLAALEAARKVSAEPLRMIIISVEIPARGIFGS